MLLLFYFFFSAIKKKKGKPDLSVRREGESIPLRKEQPRSENKPRFVDQVVISPMQKYAQENYVIPGLKRNPSRAQQLFKQTGSLRKAILLKEILDRRDC